jgi:hypothetical protein
VGAKRKKKKFSATKAVKAVARERIGAVPPTRAVPDRKKKTHQEKYKPTTQQLLKDLE